MFLHEQQVDKEKKKSYGDVETTEGEFWSVFGAEY
jgi:hypothetical protein